MCNPTTIQRIRQHSQASGTALAILYDLAHYAAGPDNHAWPAYGTLAANANVGRRAVKTAVDALEATGELFIIRRVGRSRTHAYMVTVGMGAGEIARAMVETLGMDPAEAMQAARDVLTKRGEKGDPEITFSDQKGDQEITFSGEKGDPEITRSEIIETKDIGRDEKSISGDGGEMKNNPAANLPPAVIDRYVAAYGIDQDQIDEMEITALAKTWSTYEAGPTMAALARVEAMTKKKAAAGDPPIFARAKYLRQTASRIQADNFTANRERRQRQPHHRKTPTPAANLRPGETEGIDSRRAFVMTYPAADPDPIPF